MFVVVTNYREFCKSRHSFETFLVLVWVCSEKRSLPKGSATSMKFRVGLRRYASLLSPFSSPEGPEPPTTFSLAQGKCGSGDNWSKRAKTSWSFNFKNGSFVFHAMQSIDDHNTSEKSTDVLDAFLISLKETAHVCNLECLVQVSFLFSTEYNIESSLLLLKLILYYIQSQIYL